MHTFLCRPGCAACCIAISISSPLPSHPHGKTAGAVCLNLDENHLCRVWGQPDYPAVCRLFPALPEHCGESRTAALALLSALEQATLP